jgi:hypothetical protein
VDNSLGRKSHICCKPLKINEQQEYIYPPHAWDKIVYNLRHLVDKRQKAEKSKLSML